jgi:hypothetical protein
MLALIEVSFTSFPFHFDGESSLSYLEAYGHIQRISFMQNSPGSSKRSAIFESPRSRKAVRLGPTCDTASLEPLSPLANRSAKIERPLSTTMPSLEMTFDSALAGSSVFSNDPVSSPSTLLSEQSLQDPFALGQKDLSGLSSMVTEPSPSSITGVDVHEKRYRKRGQKLQD